MRQLARKELVDPLQRICLQGMLSALDWLGRGRNVERSRIHTASKLARRDLTPEDRAALNGRFTVLNWVEDTNRAESSALQHLIDGRNVILRMTGVANPNPPVLFVSPWGVCQLEATAQG
jgi:hypothetical protein